MLLALQFLIAADVVYTIFQEKYADIVLLVAVVIDLDRYVLLPQSRLNKCEETQANINKKRPNTSGEGSAVRACNVWGLLFRQTVSPPGNLRKIAVTLSTTCHAELIVDDEQFLLSAQVCPFGVCFQSVPTSNADSTRFAALSPSVDKHSHGQS